MVGRKTNIIKSNSIMFLVSQCITFRVEFEFWIQTQNSKKGFVSSLSSNSNVHYNLVFPSRVEYIRVFIQMFIYFSKFRAFSSFSRTLIIKLDSKKLWKSSFYKKISELFRVLISNFELSQFQVWASNSKKLDSEILGKFWVFLSFRIPSQVLHCLSF